MNTEQEKALRAPFPPSQIGLLPKGGQQLEYVGHGAVTDRLLSVDPKWSWVPMAFDAHGLPALDQFGNLWILLTVCGVTRIGVGDGPTMKVLIGDALRNASMRFGVALDLWVRGQAEDDEKVADQGQGQRSEAGLPHRKIPDGWDSLEAWDDAANTYAEALAALPDTVRTNAKAAKAERGIGWPPTPSEMTELLTLLESYVVKPEAETADQEAPF